MASLNYLIMQNATGRKLSRAEEERQRQQRNEEQREKVRREIFQEKVNRIKQRNLQQEKKNQQRQQQKKQVEIPKPPARTVSPKTVKQQISLRKKGSTTDDTDTTASSTTDIELPINEDIQVHASAESEEDVHILTDDKVWSIYSDINMIADFDFGAASLNGSSQMYDFDKIWYAAEADEGNIIALSEPQAQQQDKQLLDEKEYSEENLVEEEEAVFYEDAKEFYEAILAEFRDDDHDDDKKEGEGENWFEIRPQPLRIKSEITIDSIFLP